MAMLPRFDLRFPVLKAGISVSGAHHAFKPGGHHLPFSALPQIDLKHCLAGRLSQRG
jgi:hypothetical protein